MRRAPRRRAPRAARIASLEHLRRPRGRRRRRRRRPGVDQVRAGLVRRGVLGEAVDDALGSLRRSQRETCRTMRSSGVQARVLDRSSACALDARLAAVAALERRLGRPPPSTIPAAAQDRVHLRRVELLVLRRERVDRRRDDVTLVVVEPLPHERLAREDVGVGLLDVGAQEVPGRRARGRRARRCPMWQRQITCAPARLQRAGSARRSAGRAGPRRRARRPASHELVAVGSSAALVGLALLVVERAAVALGAVQVVVEALGDLEEARRCPRSRSSARRRRRRARRRAARSSSSATPPPRAVELTFQIMRPSSSSRASTTASWTSAYCASERTSAKRSRPCSPVSTMVSALMAPMDIPGRGRR